MMMVAVICGIAWEISIRAWGRRGCHFSNPSGTEKYLESPEDCRLVSIALLGGIPAELTTAQTRVTLYSRGAGQTTQCPRN